VLANVLNVCLLQKEKGHQAKENYPTLRIDQVKFYLVL